MSEDRHAILSAAASRSSAAWEALGDGYFRGELWVVTKNATYIFRDGLCVKMNRRDDRQSTRPIVGMRLVGWFVDDGQSRTLSPEWKKHASAVLWTPCTPSIDGKTQDQQDAFILTSGTIDCHRPVGQRKAIPEAPGSGVRLTERASVLAPGSLTRIHVEPARRVG
jgi:hypothetical protein